MILLYILLGLLAYVLVGLVVVRGVHCWSQYVSHNYHFAYKVDRDTVMLVMIWPGWAAAGLMWFAGENALSVIRPAWYATIAWLDRVFVNVFAELVGRFGPLPVDVKAEADDDDYSDDIHRKCNMR